MTRSAKSSSPARYRLLAGASAVALLSAGQGAYAAPANPFARVASPSAAVTQAAQSQATQAAAVNTVSAQAQAAFAQAAALRNQMDTAQAAARAAAAAAQSSVPNGLTIGGLQVAPGAVPGSTLWQGADAPVQSTASNGHTEVSINQTAPQAILNWQTFNVGKTTDLSFVQPGATSVVLNRVSDPSANPTQILGTIKAPGTVLILNQNGVIFGGASQVNVGALLAGAANIADSQFLTSGIYSTQTGGFYNPAFTNAGGAVTVQAGAQITTNAPATVTQGGGYVLLLGQQVSNAGQIITPQGQTILVAGDNFFVRPGYGTDGNQDSTTRGSEVAVQLNTLGSSTTGGSGLVTNSGLIEADTGDVTLAGETVVNNGVLLSTTSVNVGGTIHLLSSASDAFGSVTLGQGSLAAILPDSNGATALDAQRAALLASSATQDAARVQDFSIQLGSSFDNLSLLPDLQTESRVEIVTGGNVEFQKNSLTLAPAGQVTVSAVGRVQVGAGATIDVAGLQNVTLPMSANDIAVSVEGNEQRDDPNNRDTTNLNNSTVFIDARQLVTVPAGTGGDASARAYTQGGLFEVSGWLATTPHTLGEWMASGGQITLSGGSVVAQSGSTFNISGGQIQYQGGYLQQSYVRATDGEIFNVNQAPADLTYVGAYTGYNEAHPHWGPQYTQTWTSAFFAPSQIYEAGYTVGRNAGSLTLSTPTALFEGTIDAGVTVGNQQIVAQPAGVTDPYTLAQNVAPMPGTLALGQYAPNPGGLDIFDTTVTFGANPAGVAGSVSVSDPIATDLVGTAYFDANQVSNAGLGGLSVRTGGAIAINAPLTLAPGGQMTFLAPTIDVAANLTVRGGSVSISNIDTAGSQPSGLTDMHGLAQATLESGVTISTQGLWTNGQLDPGHLSGLAFLNGGAISIDMSQGITLAQGSVINTSSGAAVLPSGKTVGGAGGNITLIADDPRVGAGLGTLILDGAFSAYGVTKGGVLTLESGQGVYIADQPILTSNALAAGQAAPVQVVLTAPVTIQAGQTMPFTYAQQFTVDGPGQSISVLVTPSINDTGIPITVGADWVVPSFLRFADDVDGNRYLPGDTVPAGVALADLIFVRGSPGFPAGYVIPADVFPQGIPINPVIVTTAAGTVLTAPITIVAGTAAPAGTVFNQRVALQPLLNLPPSLFGGGFSGYAITGLNGVTVAPGAQVNVTEPVYRFADASNAVATGADPNTALTVWTPPLYQQNPVKAVLTQRAGASLTLNGVDAAGPSVGGPVTIGSGARLAVDPGQSINLASDQQITIDGTLRAPGGAISITGAAILGNGGSGMNNNVPGQSIWIGGDAVLDVSAQAATALDQYGQPYGVVPNGGSITLGAAGDVMNSLTGIIASSYDFIVVRPGAVLDASGTSALIDPNAGAATGPFGASNPAGSTVVASNGGSITLSSYSGIYADGTLRAAAGGPGAAGGSFSVTLETPAFGTPNGVNFDFTNPAFVPRILTIGQAPLDAQLPAGLQPGASDPSLAFGQARFSADALEAGGFGSLSFTARDAIVFDGDVRLSAGQSIAFHEGVLGDASASGNVTITAPYVLLDGQTPTGPTTTFYPTLWANWQPSTQQGAGVFTVKAALIDIGDKVAFGVDSPAADFPVGAFTAIGTVAAYDYAGFANVDLVSQGDIRFLEATPGPDSIVQNPSLSTSGDLTFTAAQLYPVASSTFSNGAVLPVQVKITAGAQAGGAIDPDSIISINRISAVDPALPYSLLGSLTFSAGTINQGGVVRAPLGYLTFNALDQVNLLPGSITSTSMNGLTMLFGGTADGVTWTYNGTPLSVNGGLERVSSFQGPGSNAVTLSGPSFVVAAGATIDVSGGGNIAGASFISGEGGSVNVLATPLVNANPANTYSAAGNRVYAIVPGYQSGYAPVDPAAGAAPGIGQQITIPAGTPGLPAGAYTLLPANYALLPGGYRVELGGTATVASAGAVKTSNGGFLIDGYLGVANTGVKNALPTQLIIMPGAAVRDNSDYSETNYTDYQINITASLENIRPILAVDAGTLVLSFNGTPSNGQVPLVFDGTALFGPGTDAQSGVTGQPGQAFIYPNGVPTEVYAGAPTPGFQGLSIAGADLSNIRAPSLQIGGGSSEFSDATITVDSGVVLKAGQVTLLSGPGASITLQPGAEIDTVDMGAPPVSLSGVNTIQDVGNAELVVSNGVVNLVYLTALDSNGNPFLPTITLGDGVKLYSQGSIAFGAGGGVAISDTVAFGTANLGFSAGDINIGDPAAMASATVPAGISLTQARLNQILAGDPSVGAPPLQTLTLTASQSLNMFGSVNLDVIDPATGKADFNLLLNTPAIYGYGAASDTATLTVGTLTWSGIPGASGNGQTTPPAPPGPIVANGPGTGSGVLNIVANQITFGFPSDTPPDNQTLYNRAMYGFSTVNLIAPEITSNGRNTLAVYQAQGSDPSGPGVGGNLNLETSLLTGTAQSIMGFTTGGILSVAPPVGAAPATPVTGPLGAEIDLTAGGINVASTILLPSGMLTMTANGDINLQAGSNLDLAGQATALVDQTEYSWGGNVILQSNNGNIIQAAGSTINVSAVNSNAGMFAALATGAGAGRVALNGTLLGSATLTQGMTGDPAGGSISIAAQTLASGNAADLSADFAALNTMLTAAGFSQSRAFDLKQGDLVIGNEVQARQVNVSVDNGSLTVNGTINASGVLPGSISLAAQNDLTLNGTLDAHGTVLQTDSYGIPIAAENSGQVVLTAMQGTLTLSPGATIDLRVTDPRNLDAAGNQIVNYGNVFLNAPRTGENSGDIQVSAPGPLTILGAGSLTLNGFWAYSPTDPNGTVVQDNGDVTPVGSAAHTTTTIADILETLSTTTTTTLTTVVSEEFPLAGAVTFTATNVPTPNTAIGESTYGGYYFNFAPCFCTTVIAGSVIDHVEGLTRTPTRFPQLNGFYFNGAGTTFMPGTEIMTKGVDAGTTLISVNGAPVLLNSVRQTTTQVLSKTTTPVPIGTPTGAIVTNNPDGSVTTAVTTAAFTTFPTVVTPDPLATPAGTTSTTTVVQNGFGQLTETTVTATSANPDNGFLGLSQIDTQSQAFMNAVAGSGLLGRIAGLTAQGGAFHLRPGVQINGGPSSGGNLTVSGDLDFSGFRYSDPAGIGRRVDPNIFGSGEPGSVVFRASGNLTINGSINDGFGQSFADCALVATCNLDAPPSSPDDNGWADGQSGHHVYALAPMLPAGDLSWSMQLVAGADPGAANTQILQPLTQLGGGGNLTLNDPHTAANGTPAFSVIRTGTGNLTLLAGGDFDELTLYGVYTAGTQSPGIGPNGSDPYNLPRGLNSDGSGTVLGSGNDGYEAAIQGYQAYYPTGGGNLLVSAQGNLAGLFLPPFSENNPMASTQVGNWLWSQGGAVAGLATAWWINFGSYAPQIDGLPIALTGFTGFGALGGGNVAINVGGNASGLVAAVAGTGRVMADGTLVETGGGALTTNIGGQLNDSFFTDIRGNTVINAGAAGVIVPSYGAAYGYGFSGVGFNDPRYIDPLTSDGVANISGSLTVNPGDGAVTISTRGDLVLADVANPGLSAQPNTTPFTGGGVSYAGGGLGWFSLWTDATAINLFSAGGNLVPTEYQGVAEPSNAGLYIYPSTLNAIAASGSIYVRQSFTPGIQPALVELAPSPDGQLNLLAEGSIIGVAVAMSGADPSVSPTPFDPAFYYQQEVTPFTRVTNLSPNTYGQGQGTDLFFTFGADTPTTNLHAGDPNPIRIYAATGDIVGLDLGAVINFTPSPFSSAPPIVPSTWYIGAKPADIVAGRDIVVSPTPNLGQGSVNENYGFILNDSPTDVSLISAGRDVIYSGMQIAGPGQLVVQAGANFYAGNQASLVSLGPIVNVDPNDHSSGAGITLLAGVGAAGPNYAALASQYLNPANAADPSAPISGQPGKAIQVDNSLAELNDLYGWVKTQAGYTGDESGALAFFNGLPASQRALYPSNAVLFAWLKTQGYAGDQGDALAFYLGLPAAQQNGFTYDVVLQNWLQQNYGYKGTEASAYAFFQTLPALQQDVFLRQVYFDEINASGLDFNNPAVEDFKTYVRGRQAIATLFPNTDASGKPIAYSGDITLFGPSGVQTLFGGGIQTLTPGGATTVGVEGATPPSTAGVITQGSGDIDMYSLESVNLGESRVLTTFGGDIVIWSAAGNIDAGKGAKTTVIFTPPRILYNNYGNVALAPQVPSTGAGIGTLNPIPEIAPGDINLVAPLGIVDAGEAGIRVSGNINIAALQVANAANIQVQGAATGIPTVAAVNVGALTSASAATAAVTQIAQQMAQRPPPPPPQVPYIITGRLLGFGGE